MIPVARRRIFPLASRLGLAPSSNLSCSKSRRSQRNPAGSRDYFAGDIHLLIQLAEISKTLSTSQHELLRLGRTLLMMLLLAINSTEEKPFAKNHLASEFARPFSISCTYTPPHPHRINCRANTHRALRRRRPAILNRSRLRGATRRETTNHGCPGYPKVCGFLCSYGCVPVASLVCR